jgi:hypothetical protein
MIMGLTCWNCAAALDDVLLPVSRHEYCAACSEAVHCCRMCRHYAPGRPNACAEDRADPPTDKETANFCDFYAAVVAVPGSAGASAARDDAAARARAKLDALFGDRRDD